MQHGRVRGVKVEPDTRNDADEHLSGRQGRPKHQIKPRSPGEEERRETEAVAAADLWLLLAIVWLRKLCCGVDGKEESEPCTSSTPAAHPCA